MRYFHNWMVNYTFEDDEAVKKTKLINTYLSKICSKVPNEYPRSDDLNLYTGNAGIAYMFYHLSQNSELSKYREEYLQAALNYISPVIEKLKQKISQSADCKNRIPGLLCGYAGVYAVAATIFHKTGNRIDSINYLNLYHEAADICKEMDFSSGGSDELFVGRAGYLLGALWLAQETKTSLKIRDLHDICRIIVTSGREYSRKNSCNSPLMYAYHNKQYIGAAHGISSILLALISVPDFLDNNQKDAIDIRNSIDYLLSIQFMDGNFPSSICKPEKIKSGVSDLVHWCHGAPGVIYLMAKAYLIWKDNKYLKACEKCADLIWRRGLLKKGPGICHGIAGNGYAFLLMYRLTNDIEYYKKAKCFEYFMETDEFINQAKTPDSPYSLYEGLAGTCCFIADNLLSSNAYFPFQNVFS